MCYSIDEDVSVIAIRLLFRELGQRLPTSTTAFHEQRNILGYLMNLIIVGGVVKCVFFDDV